MSISERILYLLVGGMIGFVAGYIARALHKYDDDDDDRSFPRDWGLRDWALLVVVGLTVWASLATQFTNNTVQHTQKQQQHNQKQIQRTQAQLQKVTDCNVQFLGETITALNERTTYTLDQARANVTLQSSQLDFLSSLLQKPPPNKTQVREAFQTYVRAVTNFVEVSRKTSAIVFKNPFPTNKELQDCLNAK